MPAAGTGGKTSAAAGAMFPTTTTGGSGSMFQTAAGGPAFPAATGGAISPSAAGVPFGAPTGAAFAQLPLEQSFVENILRMNLGKVGTFYMTYENNSEWNAKIFKGVIEAAGRDHIIISDPVTGRRYLLLMVNLDYVTFDEPLNYSLPFGSAGQSGQPTRYR